MSEPELATKAPESDANETIIPGDTPAQTGPTMGEHCTTDRPTRMRGPITNVPSPTYLLTLEPENMLVRPFTDV